MDPIKAEKLQAIKRYKKAQLLNNVIIYSLAALVSCFFCSSNPFLFPFTKLPLTFSISSLLPSLFNPSKWCLFIVGNIIIVVILIRESKLAGPCSSPVNEIHDEYVRRNQSNTCRGARSIVKVEHKKNDDVAVATTMVASQERAPKTKITNQGKKGKKCSVNVSSGAKYTTSDSGQTGIEDITKPKEMAVIDDGQEKKRKERKSKEEKEKSSGHRLVKEETDLPAEDLNRRVEDFIARVNSRRRLEASLLVGTRA